MMDGEDHETMMNDDDHNNTTTTINTTTLAEKNGKKEEKDDEEEKQVSSSAIAAQNSGSGCREYSNIFYCPLTKEIMKDPIVLANGNSYEKHVIQQAISSLPSSAPTPQRNKNKNGNTSGSMSISININMNRQDENDTAGGNDSNITRAITIPEGVVSILKKHKENSADAFYPNRALQAIISKAINPPPPVAKKPIIRAPSRQTSTTTTTKADEEDMLQSSSRSNGHDTDNNNSNNNNNKKRIFPPLADEYFCPITSDLMHDPVIDCEGCTYERVAIAEWIRKTGKSPMTRKKMSVKQLYKNRALLALIVDKDKGGCCWLPPNKDNDENENNAIDNKINPLIRRWMKEHKQHLLQKDSSTNQYSNDDDDDLEANWAAMTRAGDIPDDDLSDSIDDEQQQLREQQRRQRARRKKMKKICTQILLMFLFLVICIYIPHIFFFSLFLFIFLCTERARNRSAE